MKSMSENKSTIECSHSAHISVGMELCLLLVNMVATTHM